MGKTMDNIDKEISLWLATAASFFIVAAILLVI
jgi:uncharacterized membrane protein